MTEARRLPRVAMETLVLIALHQPVTRPEIEERRGAALAQTTMDLLLESGLHRHSGSPREPSNCRHGRDKCSLSRPLDFCPNVS